MNNRDKHAGRHEQASARDVSAQRDAPNIPVPALLAPGLAALDAVALNAEFRRACAREDGPALCALNAEAARRAAAHNDAGACRFFLTQAWVFALCADLPEQHTLLQTLQRCTRT